MTIRIASGLAVVLVLVGGVCFWGDGVGLRDDFLGRGGDAGIGWAEKVERDEEVAESVEGGGREYPVVATERLIRVTLGMLARNGADLRKPMPSKHRVVMESEEAVERVVAWARSSDYEVGEVGKFHEHGGEERYVVDVVRVRVPEAREIEAQGREVFAAVGRINGAEYQTWEGGMVR